MPPDVPEFRPPFCPRPNCPSHQDPTSWTYTKDGFHRRKSPPHRVQRYNCGCCGANFSSQCFVPTYWLKRPDLLLPIFHRLNSCSGFRQIGREFHVAHTTIMRQSERLGRHCFLFQWLAMMKVTLNEAIVIDGFESFAHSQYYPCHLHLAVGSESHFLYAFTDSELRRKGRMTEFQKRRRQELEEKHGRPESKSVENEMAALLRLLPVGEAQCLEVRSDEHPAYPRAIRRSGLTICHKVTPSTVPRTRYNPLFPVNLADLLIRHSGANHKRETIAFSKTRQNAVERLAIFQVWRNFVKSFSEKKQDASPAMRLGLADSKLTVEEVLRKRLFPWKVPLPERLQEYYWRKVVTTPRGLSRPHNLVFAH